MLRLPPKVTGAPGDAQPGGPRRSGAAPLSLPVLTLGSLSVPTQWPGSIALACGFRFRFRGSHIACEEDTA